MLQGWDRRYDRLVDWVTETEGGFRDDLLAEIPVIDLLTVPVSDLAERWRHDAGRAERRRTANRDRGGARPRRHRALPGRAGPPAGAAERLFTGDELALAAAHVDPVPALPCGRGQEAVMKALGVGLGAFAFHDVEVRRLRRPRAARHRRRCVLADERGVTGWHISLSHGHHRRSGGQRLRPFYPGAMSTIAELTVPPSPGEVVKAMRAAHEDGLLRDVAAKPSPPAAARLLVENEERPSARWLLTWASRPSRRTPPTSASPSARSARSSITSTAG